ncbi:MAG: hypothetical protein U0744_04395 [Gemmataceae bacterium]
MKFKFSSRLFVNATWCAAFGTAMFVMLAHRPETLAPKVSLDSGPNEYLTETQPLRVLFMQIERDLAAGKISLEKAIETAESFMENSLQHEALRDFSGSTERERLSHMLLLWVERRGEHDAGAPSRERLQQLGREHQILVPGSPPFPGERR